jgi:nitroimidazol reductase NimA-like FMN-containing flavoprotein (pyridoxamine 5'-phosphate oxidase superfamily)
MLRMNPTSTNVQDRNGLSVLSRTECLELLASVPIGRVAATVGALPVILPVNFTLSASGDILFRTGDGHKMHAMLHDTVIAFEADVYDAVARAGWSVLVQDRARVLGPIEAEEHDEVRLDTWADLGPTELVILRTDLISGRRLVPIDGC